MTLKVRALWDATDGGSVPMKQSLLAGDGTRLDSVARV